MEKPVCEKRDESSERLPCHGLSRNNGKACTAHDAARRTLT